MLGYSFVVILYLDGRAASSSSLLSSSCHRLWLFFFLFFFTELITPALQQNFPDAVFSPPFFFSIFALFLFLFFHFDDGIRLIGWWWWFSLWAIKPSESIQFMVLLFLCWSGRRFQQHWSKARECLRFQWAGAEGDWASKFWFCKWPRFNHPIRYSARPGGLWCGVGTWASSFCLIWMGRGPPALTKDGEQASSSHNPLRLVQKRVQPWWSQHWNSIRFCWFHVSHMQGQDFWTT